jgi:glycosidase
VPLVYYGDEIGMEGGDDPDARRCMGWDETKWDRKIVNTHRTLVRARRERPWLAFVALVVLALALLAVRLRSRLPRPRRP